MYFNHLTRRTSPYAYTARKLAVIIWNMVTKGEQYNPPEEYSLEEKRKLKVLKNFKKNINKFGITPDDIGFATN